MWNILEIDTTNQYHTLKTVFRCEEEEEEEEEGVDSIFLLKKTNPFLNSCQEVPSITLVHNAETDHSYEDMIKKLNTKKKTW